MTARAAAFRGAFYRCCTSDLARIRLITSRHAGFLALTLNGEPVTYAVGDPASQRRYLAALERVDDAIAREALGLNLWEGR